MLPVSSYQCFVVNTTYHNHPRLLSNTHHCCEEDPEEDPASVQKLIEIDNLFIGSNSLTSSLPRFALFFFRLEGCFFDSETLVFFLGCMTDLVQSLSILVTLTKLVIGD